MDDQLIGVGCIGVLLCVLMRPVGTCWVYCQHSPCRVLHYNKAHKFAVTQNLYLPRLTMLFGDKKVKFPVPVNCKGSILFVKSLIESKEFLAVIDREYMMDEIKAAYDYVASGKKWGNQNCRFALTLSSGSFGGGSV